MKDYIDIRFERLKYKTLLENRLDAEKDTYRRLQLAYNRLPDSAMTIDGFVIQNKLRKSYRNILKINKEILDLTCNLDNFMV